MCRSISLICLSLYNSATEMATISVSKLLWVSLTTLVHPIKNSLGQSGLKVGSAKVFHINFDQSGPQKSLVLDQVSVWPIYDLLWDLLSDKNILRRIMRINVTTHRATCETERRTHHNGHNFLPLKLLQLKKYKKKWERRKIDRKQQKVSVIISISF